MRACEHTIWDLPNELRCVETGAHETHTFRSTSVDDGKHDDAADLEVWE